MSRAVIPDFAQPDAGVVPFGRLRALGRYRLLRQLGAGGMSVVYLSFDTESHEQVAIKILLDHLAYEPAFVDRFRREGQISRLLVHPNLIRGVASAQDHATGIHYLVFEYIDGPSVQRLLDQQGRLAPDVAAHVAREIAAGLDYLHHRNYVHRDIKPSNILLNPNGHAQLIDFGLAARLDESRALGTCPATLGTPYYMAPEQACDPAIVNGRADLFALGATLYHMLTGEVPFSGADHTEIQRQKEAGVLIPASRRTPGVPETLDYVLARLLDPNPMRRFGSAWEVVEVLSASGVAAGLGLTPALPSVDPSLELVDEGDLAKTQPDLPTDTNPNPGVIPAPTPLPKPTYRPRSRRFCPARGFAMGFSIALAVLLSTGALLAAFTQLKHQPPGGAVPVDTPCSECRTVPDTECPPPPAGSIIVSDQPIDWEPWQTNDTAPPRAVH